jgi:hypothetical protein
MQKIHYWILGIVGSFGIILLAWFLTTTFLQSPSTAPRLHAAEIVWTGSGGDGIWNNPENWSTKSVPAILDRVTIDNATVTVPNGQHISFDTLIIGTGGITNVIFEGDIDRARDIHIGSHGFLVQKNNRPQIISGTLSVENEGTLTHAPNMTSLEFGVMFYATDIRIDPGGIINIDGLGYAPGQAGPGAGTTSLDGAGGGANGGAGGNGAVGAGGTAYCNADNVMLGSGGGNGSPESSGAGGGLSILKAAHTIELNGIMHANGYDGMTQNAGGGAGGGIVLVATTITGTPQEISIRGGKGNTQGGGGGGGCMLIKYVTSNSITEGMISKEGGSTSEVTSESLINSNILPVPPSTTLDSSSTTEVLDTVVSSSSPTNATLTLDTADSKSGEPGKIFIIQISDSSMDLPIIPVFTTSSPLNTDTSSASNSIIPGIFYFIEQAGPEETFVVVSSTPQLPVSYTFTELASSTFYQFRVRFGDTIFTTTSVKTSTSTDSYTWVIPQGTDSGLPKLPDALKLLIPTSTVSSTRTIITTKLPLLKVLFENSHVQIKNIPTVSEFYPGDLVSYVYDFRNTFPDRQRFKVVRQIISEGTGKIILNKESSLTLRESQNFSFTVNERLPLSVKNGVFIARVLIINANGEQIDGNGFRFIIQER